MNNLQSHPRIHVNKKLVFGAESGFEPRYYGQQMYAKHLTLFLLLLLFLFSPCLQFRVGCPENLCLPSWLVFEVLLVSSPWAMHWFITVFIELHSKIATRVRIFGYIPRIHYLQLLRSNWSSSTAPWYLLWVIISSGLKPMLSGKYCSHFTDGETESQRVYITYPM